MKGCGTDCERAIFREEGVCSSMSHCLLSFFRALYLQCSKVFSVTDIINH